MKYSTLGFYGGVGSVTGANFMLDTGEAAFLVDCGLLQGGQFAEDTNAEDFVYDPASIDVLMVTHAHADHIGRIPKLVKDGFRGSIYSTPPTKDLANVMLRDALKVMRYESERYGRIPLYEESDIDHALTLWKTAGYGEQIDLPDNVTAEFSDAGHILGSAMVRFTRAERSIVFTGDIGNVPQPLLNPPTVPTNYHYLVMESVYGDRQHEQVEERTELLRFYIEDTIKKGGTLMIPAFSLERTQGMLYEINNLVEEAGMEAIPVFLDSPLAISVTGLYQQYPEYLKDSVQAEIREGDDIFSFPKLQLTRSRSESASIHETEGPKIIIAGSGMSHGGRIRDHEKRYLQDPDSTLLLVGYQSVGSVGRMLHDGARHVTIDDQEIQVKARIARIRGYSGHADRDQLLELVHGGGEQCEHVFVTMGEERSSLFLVQRLRDYLGLTAVAPSLDEEIEIQF